MTVCASAKSGSCGRSMMLSGTCGWVSSCQRPYFEVWRGIPNSTKSWDILKFQSKTVQCWNTPGVNTYISPIFSKSGACWLKAEENHTTRRRCSWQLGSPAGHSGMTFLASSPANLDVTPLRSRWGGGKPQRKRTRQESQHDTKRCLFCLHEKESETIRDTRILTPKTVKKICLVRSYCFGS